MLRRASWIGAALLAATGLVGCESKLLSPTECETLALNVARVQARQLKNPEIRSFVEQLTDKCLTVPFDREMGECTRATGNLEYCLRGLGRRLHE
jgi:hypothetical protein